MLLKSGPITTPTIAKRAMEANPTRAADGTRVIPKAAKGRADMKNQ